ncbi:MAG: response regulator [Desulfocucumaceae bacterium]
MYNAAVIDTDSGCLELMARLLNGNCYIASVTCFSLMSDYLSELKKGNIQVVFIRVGSPGLQGLSLTKVTQTVSPATRVVFMSCAESYAVMAFEEKACGYLVLPAEQKGVDEVIENIKRRDSWKWGD